MKRMKRDVELLLHHLQTGTKVVITKPHEITVYNCGNWNYKHSAWINLHYPDALVTFESSTCSLSGFVVILQRPSHQLQTLAIALTLILGACYLLAYTSIPSICKDLLGNYTQGHVVYRHI